MSRKALFENSVGTSKRIGYVLRATDKTRKGEIKLMLFVNKIFLECVV